MIAWLKRLLFGEQRRIDVSQFNHDGTPRKPETYQIRESEGMPEFFHGGFDTMEGE